MENSFDVIIIGGGQSGLAVGYYLRRTDLSFVLLDKSDQPGGAWQHHWKSLRLFSPAQWSSLHGYSNWIFCGINSTPMRGNGYSAWHSFRFQNNGAGY